MDTSAFDIKFDENGFCNYCSDCTIDDYDSCIPNINICNDINACNFTEINFDFTFNDNSHFSSPLSNFEFGD